MKHWIYIFLFAITSCNNQQQKAAGPEPLVSARPHSSTDSKTETCWTGTLNNKTPVFIHYQVDDNIIIGEITYLNTKDKVPITLLGTIEHDKSYRLLEFEKSGNITGIITGLPTDKIFDGSWFSPLTRKELALNLVKKDTVIIAPKTDTQLNDVFGNYHYQYSEAGYQGDFEIIQLPNSAASFEIFSVTSEPARNMAQIDKDTISLNSTQFIYNLHNSKDCQFQVKFFKGFTYIKYTNGSCEGQFGHNAAIDGIFLKTK